MRKPGNETPGEDGARDIHGQGSSGAPQGSNGKKAAEIKLKMPDEVQAGVYVNTMLVHHSRDEFVMDFGMVIGNAGTIVARVVTNPSHMKRIAAALHENIRRYEAAHGPIKGSEPSPPISFRHPPQRGEDN